MELAKHFVKAIEANGIEGILLPGQGEALATLAMGVPDNGHIVEIGAFKGLSTGILRTAAPDTAKLSTIDPFDKMIGSAFVDRVGGYWDTWEDNMKRIGMREKIIKIADFSERVAQTWNEPIDLLLVDGDHQEGPVILDVTGFFPHVKSGGVIAMHDYGCGFVGVDKAWNTLVKPSVENIGRCKTLIWGTKL